MYIYIYIYKQDVTQGNFQTEFNSLNSEFSFRRLVAIPKFKCSVAPYCLPIARERID